MTTSAISRVRGLLPWARRRSPTGPYRNSVASAQALLELRRCAGAQFDPAVVEVFGEALLEAERRTIRSAGAA